MKKKLEDIALYQYGIFTAKQAENCGYTPKHHAYHVRKKHWKRIGYGLYKIAGAKENLNYHCMKWVLWSRNKQGQSQGVISHNTALVYFGLIDNGGKENIHLTVPTYFRKWSLPTEGLYFTKKTWRYLSLKITARL